MTKILDVGCGHKKRPGAVGIDILEDSDADIVHDLNSFPWPIDDDEFDVIYATHVLEHLEDVIKIMEELHRILKPGGRLIIETPHYTSWNAYTDPTHRRFFGFRSFNYFIEGTCEERLQYSDVRFKLIHVFLGNRRGQKKPDWKKPLEAIFLKMINRLPGLYEKRWAFIRPVQNIYLELQAVKDSS